jgi:hypothetical protein
MLHEIRDCKWDEKTRTVTSPTSHSELSKVIEFENQDWVKILAQADNSAPTKKYIDPNAAFPFQDEFSVGTIHGANLKSPSNNQGTETGTMVDIVDNDDGISILTSKIQDLNERQRSTSAIGRRAAPGVDSCASGPTANAAPTGANETAPIAAAGSQIPACTSNDGRVNGGMVGE